MGARKARRVVPKSPGHRTRNIKSKNPGSAQVLESQQEATEVRAAQLVLQGVTQHLGTPGPRMPTEEHGSLKLQA